jgi:hypothetical protein
MLFLPNGHISLPEPLGHRHQRRIFPSWRKPYRVSGSPTGRPFSLWPWPRHPSPMAGKDRDEIAWLDIEVAGWPAGRAFDLEEFAVPGKIAESYWAMWRW